MQEIHLLIQMNNSINFAYVRFRPVDNDSALYFSILLEYGHPVSGMAKERNTTAEVVTTGGTGFGIAAMGSNRQRIYNPIGSSGPVK